MLLQTVESVSAPIDTLPSELLAHVFALLSPSSLLAATLVCRAWHHVATDETSWRTAFATYYNLSSDARAPGRRLDATSWRNEYLLRTRLLRKWGKSRDSATTYDTRAGQISDLVVSLTDAIAVSTTGSSASRTDLQTGHILRTNIQPGVEPGQVTCAKANENGTAIAWGLRDGEVRVSVTHPSLPASHALVHLLAPESSHRGSVCGISFAPYPGAFAPSKITFATAAYDGLVKVWDSEFANSTLACVFTSDALHKPNGEVDLTSSIAFAPSHRFIAVGTEGGALHVWRLDRGWRTLSYAHIPPKGAAVAAIVTICLDASLSTADMSVLIRRITSSSIERYWPFSEAPQDALVFSHHSSISITAVAVDFAFSKTVGFGSSKYIATGDEQGTVALWMWQHRALCAAPLPAKILQKKAGGLPAVTAIALSDLLVLVGSIDGIVKAYDPLSGQTLRILADRSNPRQAIRALAAGLGTNEERERYAISHLRAFRLAVVATAGAKIIAWHIDESRSKIKRRKIRVNPGVRNNIIRMEKLKDERQTLRDLQDIRQELYVEQEARLGDLRHLLLVRQANGEDTLKLTEEEALAYAMMLSAEEAQQKSSLVEYMDTPNPDYDQLFEEDAGELLVPSSRAHMTSLSLASPSRHLGLVGLPASLRSDQCHRLSPPTNPRIPPDLADEFAWPSPSSRSPLLAQAKHEMPNPSDVPAARRTFSEAARSNTSIAGDPSHSVHRDSYPIENTSAHAESPVKSRDVDLQFAIELSLAETECRRDE